MHAGQYIKDVNGTGFEASDKQIRPVRMNPLGMPIVGVRSAWTAESFHAVLTTVGDTAPWNVTADFQKAKPESAGDLPLAGSGFSYYISSIDAGIIAFETAAEAALLRIASSDLSSTQVVIWSGIIPITGNLIRTFGDAIPVGDNLSLAATMLMITNAADDLQAEVHITGYRMKTIATTAPA